MKPRHVILLLGAAGISIGIWASCPRPGVAAEAVESFQQTELWLGGQLINRPQRLSAPPPPPLAEDDDAGRGKTTGEQGATVVVPHVLRQSSNAAGESASAQVAGRPLTSHLNSPDLNSPIAMALDECLRQNHATPMMPPRPLREPVSQPGRPRPVAEDQVLPPAPAMRAESGDSVPGDNLQSRRGRPQPTTNHEQVSYVAPRVPPSAFSGQGDDVPGQRPAQGPTAADSPCTKAASSSTSPAHNVPLGDTASAHRTELPPSSPHTPARPDAPGASQHPQPSLSQLLTLLGIVALVLVVQRRWAAGRG